MPNTAWLVQQHGPLVLNVKDFGDFSEYEGLSLI